MTPLTARKALEATFLEARSKLLDLAAILDRIDRGDGVGDLNTDPRLARIRQALEILHDAPEGRAEQIQRLFSLEYDPTWEKPQPREKCEARQVCHLAAAPGLPSRKP